VVVEWVRHPFFLLITYHYMLLGVQVNLVVGRRGLTFTVLLLLCTKK